MFFVGSLNRPFTSIPPISHLPPPTYSPTSSHHKPAHSCTQPELQFRIRIRVSFLIRFASCVRVCVRLFARLTVCHFVLTHSMKRVYVCIYVGFCFCMCMYWMLLPVLHIWLRVSRYIHTYT